MPASSKSQQKFMALAYLVKSKKLKPGQVSDSVRRAAKSMSKQDLHDFAATKTKNLPDKAEKSASFLDKFFVRGFLSRVEEAYRASSGR